MIDILIKTAVTLVVLLTLTVLVYSVLVGLDYLSTKLTGRR